MHFLLKILLLNPCENKKIPRISATSLFTLGAKKLRTDVSLQPTTLAGPSAIATILENTRGTRRTAAQMRDDMRPRNDRGREEPQGHHHDGPNVPALPILPLSNLTPENADEPAVDAGIEAIAQPPGAEPVGAASAGAALQADEHHTTSHIPTTEDTTTPMGELRARARRLAARAGAQLNGAYDGIRDGRLAYGSVAPHEVDNFNLMIDWTMWYIMCSKDDVVNDDIIVQRVINWYLTRRWSRRLREEAVEQPPPQTGGQTTTPTPPAHEPPQLVEIHDTSTQTEGTSTTTTSEVATSTSWPCTRRWQRWNNGWRSADGRWISCWTCANGGHKGGWDDKCPKPPPDDEVRASAAPLRLEACDWWAETFPHTSYERVVLWERAALRRLHDQMADASLWVEAKERVARCVEFNHWFGWSRPNFRIL